MTTMLNLSDYIAHLSSEFNAQEVVRFLLPLRVRRYDNKLQLLACNRYMHAWLQQHRNKFLKLCQTTSIHAY